MMYSMHPLLHAMTMLCMDYQVESYGLMHYTVCTYYDPNLLETTITQTCSFFKRSRKTYVQKFIIYSKKLMDTALFCNSNNNNNNYYYYIIIY